MMGRVTRHMLPHLPHTWGPPPPCKKALSKKQGKLKKTNQKINLALLIRTEIRRQCSNATIETVPYFIGACAFTGIHHSDIIVFKNLRFHPLTRLQQNSVKDSWTKKDCSGQRSFGSLATETSFESRIFEEHIKSHRLSRLFFFSVIALLAILSIEPRATTSKIFLSSIGVVTTFIRRKYP